jgi:hypothetical protein
MVRFRIHMVITADGMRRPISYRTDIFQSEKSMSATKAMQDAELVLISSFPLPNLRILSMTSSVIMIEMA